MEFHHVLFLIWAIVFVMWLVKQFSEHNRRKGR
jgi:flagellar biogenesis protein FliO